MGLRRDRVSTEVRGLAGAAWWGRAARQIETRTKNSLFSSRIRSQFVG